MFRFSVAVVAALLNAAAFAQAPKFPGVGRLATPAEVRAWDIDVRADFKGLPAGSGTVAKGQDVWDAKCASCHGVFGESNQTFPPIVGGTKKDDAARGRVQALLKPDEGRTTMMKLSQLSTLWDYINRSMPWNNPRTLSTEEVYAVTAYILNLAELVPDDFTLSDRNMAEVQKRLPNRDGMTARHGLWDTKGKPDVAATACMTHCAGEPKVVSSLPEHARDSHGNLADQHRTIGPVRGQVTARATAQATPVASATPDVRALATRNACLACHGVDSRIVGPSFREIATKYQGNANARGQVLVSVKNGGVGVWGQVPMPAQGHVNEADITTLVDWILAGAK